MLVLVCLGVQPLARGLIEQMDKRRIGFQADLVARIELMALAEHGNHLFAAETGEHLRLRTGGLDHDDLGLGAVIGDGEMFRPHAIDSGPSVGIGRSSFEGPSGNFTPFGPSKLALPLALTLPLRKFIAGEPMKLATNWLSGRS